MQALGLAEVVLWLLAGEWRMQTSGLTVTVQEWNAVGKARMGLMGCEQQTHHSER